jgi:energy-coupling factor transporter ATP-binding protein EcfA2
LTFTFRPAVREKIGLLFALAGPSGSGKTFTAMMLARGIANGTGRVAVIDTEAGRALHYAPKAGEAADGVRTFDFLHLDFPAPFTPERYVEAIRAAEAAGATVIVIDSMSHEWAGEGGCSDIQAVEAEKLATDRKTGEVAEWKIDAMTAPAWKKPKMRHARMMARLIQTRSHLIFCLRAQEKIKIVKKANGPGTEIVPIGFQPICEKSFMFEMSGSFMLHPERPGAPDYAMPHKLNADLQAIFVDGERVGADAGKRLREWAEAGVDRPPPDKAAMVARDLIERADDIETAQALFALVDDAKAQEQRAWLKSKRPELSQDVEAAFMAADARTKVVAPAEGVAE